MEKQDFFFSSSRSSPIIEYSCSHRQKLFNHYDEQQKIPNNNEKVDVENDVRCWLSSGNTIHRRTVCPVWAHCGDNCGVVC